MFTKLLTAAAIASMATAPVLAAPNSASSLSLSSVRASTSTGKKSELAPAVLIGVLATVAIVGGAVILADSDDSPDSK